MLFRSVSKKVTEKDLSSATELLDNLIVPKLRKQKAVRPTLTYYCITFYVIDVESGSRVIYNTNTSVGCGRAPCDIMGARSDISENTLVAATIKAEQYKIKCKVFYEEGMTCYRFAISV